MRPTAGQDIPSAASNEENEECWGLSWTSQLKLLSFIWCYPLTVIFFIYSLKLIQIWPIHQKSKKIKNNNNIQEHALLCSGQTRKCKTKWHKPPCSSICHTFCFLLKWHMLLDIQGVWGGAFTGSCPTDSWGHPVLLQRPPEKTAMVIRLQACFIAYWQQMLPLMVVKV